MVDEPHRESDPKGSTINATKMTINSTPDKGFTLLCSFAVILFLAYPNLI